MDLSTGFDIPNPYGLLAADFDHDMGSYRACLAFLSDLSGGTPEDRALRINGGDAQLLTAWQGSRKVRRVLAKCREAGEAARRAYTASRKRHIPPNLWPSANRLDRRFDPYRIYGP